ncbi:uncharacterized protein BCR38DRAFT_478045 [Pseudomassariella vexata]|uniref:Copper acquisition factor BIM1-like domain-containing protein n=1 Tax=Pseudomassariella vexata TaxID=1141098 RepID=A0A1Y2DG28_9PEZI|nr:uncharacterized protein BCR38DRAFT_478045 [Pseudomassariella vexata]ORY58242.1 hypothetical protein BCR38DRAFT_478045 [Pseudomassariella vexata]
MFSTSLLLANLALLATVNATFILQTPIAIGGCACKGEFDQKLEPCGGFDPTDRSVVSPFPAAGQDIMVSSANYTSTFYFKAALVTDLHNWVELRPSMPHHGDGQFCFSRIRGKNAWVDRDVVLQISQYEGNGITNYQCAAVRFTNALYAQGGCTKPATPGRGLELPGNHAVEKRHPAVDVNDTTALSGRDATSTPVKVNDASALVRRFAYFSPIAVLSAAVLPW